MGQERRYSERKDVDFIQINDLTSVADYSLIAKNGMIINASSHGFLMELHRDQIVPEQLRAGLSLEATLGQHICLYLPQMNLDLDGTITRAHHVGKGIYQIAVDFSNDVPEYWRDCLIDLLPQPGEFDHDE